MHDHAGGIAVILLALALFGICTVVGAANLRRREEQYDATLKAQRAPGMGEFKPAAGREHIAAMQARNEAAEIDWAAMEAELRAPRVYDIHDDFHPGGAA